MAPVHDCYTLRITYQDGHQRVYRFSVLSMALRAARAARRLHLPACMGMELGRDTPRLC